MKGYNKHQFDLRILITPWYLQTLLILVIDRKKTFSWYLIHVERMIRKGNSIIEDVNEDILEDDTCFYTVSLPLYRDNYILVV
jgi:hypothetical protein